MQSRYLASDLLGDRHYRHAESVAELRPSFARATRALDESGFLGIADFYSATMCLFHYHNIGDYSSSSCSCRDKQRTSSLHHIKHQVPRYNISDLSATTLAMVRALTRLDALVFGHSLRSFQKRVDEARKATGVDILCGDRWKFEDLLRQYPNNSSTTDSTLPSLEPEGAEVSAPPLCPLSSDTVSKATEVKNLLPPGPLGQSTSLAIPTSLYHVGNGCLERTLTCIERGSVLPREVIVSVGRKGTDAQNAVVAELEAEWAARLPGFRVVRTAAHSEGTNRNAAVRNATAPVVSFMDADDVPARDRVEVIETAFREHPQLDYLLHHHAVFYKEQASAVGHDWWLRVTSLPTRHHLATGHVHYDPVAHVQYDSQDPRAGLLYDIGQTRLLRKKFGRRRGDQYGFGACVNLR